MISTIPSFIYFDHNATTPVDSRVLEAMLPYFSDKFGNAASITYALGLGAKAAVDGAREKVAQMIHCIPQEITFTSGSTESLNTIIKGIFWRYRSKGNHFVSLPTEHQAVLDTLQWITSQGAEVSFAKVRPNGLVDIADLKAKIRPDTIAVIAMLANNETGVIQPIRELSEMAHQNGSLLVCDATQAIGKMEVDVQALGIDAMTCSAHKFYGPKGVGMMFLRRKSPRVSIEALIHGGGHERGNRSGTLNVTGIVGIGKAAELTPEFIQCYRDKILPIRKYIEETLGNYGIATINCQETDRLSNTINARLQNLRAELVIKHIQHKVAISTGSACSASDPKPSHVLLAMGHTEEEAHHTIRISLGVENTMEEAQIFIDLLRKINS